MTWEVILHSVLDMNINKQIVISTAIGGGLELFDFVIYLFLSQTIALLFYPQQKSGTAFLITLGGFAAGYFARPLGGMIYGHFGDRIGRRRTLTLSLFLMALPTFLMSCLPTYAHIGIWAPTLLVIFRFAQGLAMGGDIPGAICFIGEHAHRKQRGFMTCCLLFGMNMGAVIASILVAALLAFLTPTDMQSFGWRIPFLIGAFLAIVGFYIRRFTFETPEFQHYINIGKLERWPIKTLVHQHIRPISLGFAAACLAATITAVMSLFMSTYMSHYMGMKPHVALCLNSISISMYSLSCLGIGYLIDRFNALSVLKIGAISIFILAYPIYQLISQHNLILVMLGLLISAPILASIMGSIPSLLIDLFPTPIRYSGVGVSYNFGFSLCAGTAPLLVVYFISVTGSYFLPAFFIMVSVSVTLPFILLLHKNNKQLS